MIKTDPTMLVYDATPGPMKIEIKNRCSGLILFSLATDSMKLAVEAAVKQKTNLSFASLDGASLERANLEGADLYGACINRACLYGANLSWTNLTRANLDRANLDKTDLRGACLYGTDLTRATLERSNLERANLYEANLEGVNLKEANLKGANITRINLYGANLEGANLDGAYIERADGEKLNLVGRRPLLIIGPLGSRSDYLKAFLTDHGLYLKTGCFFGTRDAFVQAVVDMHKDNEHAREYRAALTLIEAHAALWTPTA